MTSSPVQPQPLSERQLREGISRTAAQLREQGLPGSQEDLERRVARALQTHYREDSSR